MFVSGEGQSHVIRIDRVWQAAKQLDRDSVVTEITQMTDKELATVLWAADALRVEATRRMRWVERQKVAARIERYGHALGLPTRKR